MAGDVKTVTFTYQDGSIRIFGLGQSIKGIKVNGNRPIKATFNFSKEDEKPCSKAELENIYCGIIPSLHPMLGVVVYEGGFDVYPK